MDEIDREEHVRRRAYQLWEQEGRPEGRDTAHWSQAEAELEVAPVRGDGVAGDGADNSGTRPSRAPARNARRAEA